MPSRAGLQRFFFLGDAARDAAAIRLTVPIWRISKSQTLKAAKFLRLLVWVRLGSAA